MAEIESSIVTHLKATSAITALVSTRVYDGEEPEVEKFPYIVVRPTDNPRGKWTQTLYGGAARISIYCYASTVASARSVGQAIINLYDTFNGTAGTHTIEYVEISNARTLFGPDGDFRFLVDLIAHYH